MMEQAKTDLETNMRDHVAGLAKGVAGMVPVVGPIVAEVVNNIIPNQRFDRISRFVVILEEKVKEINREIIEMKIRDEYFIDLLEDGFILASRAITDQRKEYIATIIKNSITEEALSHLEEKKILSIFSELNDAEIIILQSHALTGEEQRLYFSQHKEIIQYKPVHLGSSGTEINKDAIHGSFTQNLVALNLLTPQYVRPRRNELPEFDEKTGMMKARGYRVTILGNLLLSYLDLKTSF